MIIESTALAIAKTTLAMIATGFCLGLGFYASTKVTSSVENYLKLKKIKHEANLLDKEILEKAC